MTSPQPTIVHEFEQGRGTIRASLSSFRGCQRIDLRLWVEPRDAPGADLIPTQRGVNLPAEYVDELVEAAHALAAAVKR